MKYNNVIIALLGLSLLDGTALASHNRSFKANQALNDFTIPEPTLTVQPVRGDQILLNPVVEPVDPVLGDPLPVKQIQPVRSIIKPQPDILVASEPVEQIQPVRGIIRPEPDILVASEPVEQIQPVRGIIRPEPDILVASEPVDPALVDPLPTEQIQPVRSIIKPQPDILIAPKPFGPILVDPLPEDPRPPKLPPIVVDPYFAGICTAEDRKYKMCPKSVSMSCICYTDGTCEKRYIDKCSSCLGDNVFSVVAVDNEEECPNFTPYLCPVAQSTKPRMCPMYATEGCKCTRDGKCQQAWSNSCSACGNPDTLAWFQGQECPADNLFVEEPKETVCTKADRYAEFACMTVIRDYGCVYYQNGNRAYAPVNACTCQNPEIIKYVSGHECPELTLDEQIAVAQQNVEAANSRLEEAQANVVSLKDQLKNAQKVASSAKDELKSAKAALKDLQQLKKKQAKAK